MFDVCVDSEELMAILSELSNMKAALLSSTSEIRGQLMNLSSDLEGRQFVKANKITNYSCTTVSETAINVELLIKFIDSLILCIKEYYSLTYGGVR